jgi:Diaminopimelate decarboxylase
MYDSHHDLEIYRNGALMKERSKDPVTVVGNICESGDIMAKDRHIPQVVEGDIIGVMDAGAYGYSMASNYNNRLRPAEVMITMDGSVRLIRRRDTFEDLMRNFV